MPIISGLQAQTPVQELLWASLGILAETYNREAQPAQSSTGTGNLRGGAVELRAGVTVSNITCNVVTAGVAVTAWQHALYSATYALLANSASSPASVQATGNVTLAMVTPYVVTTTDLYYLAVWGTIGTTMPVLAVSATGVAIGEAIGGTARSSLLQVGLGALPNPAVPSGGPIIPWLAAS